MLESCCNSVAPPLAEIVFRGSLSPWIAYPLIGVALVAVFAVYFRESMRMNPVMRILMALLRGLTIACIILLLRKPVLVSEQEATKPRPIAIVIDNSQSMGQRDPRSTDEDKVRMLIAENLVAPDHPLSLEISEASRLIDERKLLPSRAEMVQGVFQNPRLNLLEELKKKGPLQPYLFGLQLHGAPSDWEKKIPANESKTALYYAISQILKRDDNELPAAIVIATDGLDNDRQHRIPWEDIGRECKRLEIPLHIYGVGGSANRLLQLRTLESNPRDTFLTDSAVSVTFRWKCQGVKAGMVKLTVKLGGKEVATKQVPVKEGDDLSEVLSFIPKKEDISGGAVNLEGTISLVDGKETDKISYPVRVVESKVKVLYVENAPRWEFKFLMRALQREKVVEPSFVLVSGDDKSVKAGPPFLPFFPKTRKELFAYDMIIIGDVDPALFTLEQQKWIAEFVDEGGGLVMIAGRKFNPSGYLNSPIGKILPVEFGVKTFPIDDNKRPLEYLPRLSEIGRFESLMSLADLPEENYRVWANLPGWYWFYPVTGLKPAAQSLLDHPKELIDDPSPLSKDNKRPMPLIARQYYGRGIVMFVGSDETWRWRFNEADKYFARFWGQVVYQLGLPHVLGNKTQLISEGDFQKGKPTKVYARLFTPDNRPLQADRMRADLDGAGKKASEQVVFEAVPNQPGLFVATITKDQPGDYNLRMSLNLTDSVTLPVRVTVPTEDELAPGNLNEKVLRSLADLTESVGGKFYREEDLKDLASNVKEQVIHINPPPRKEILLWTRWWVLATVIGLLTLEWLIRKFCNLS